MFQVFPAFVVVNHKTPTYTMCYQLLGVVETSTHAFGRESDRTDDAFISRTR